MRMYWKIGSVFGTILACSVNNKFSKKGVQEINLIFTLLDAFVGNNEKTLILKSVKSNWKVHRISNEAVTKLMFVWRQGSLGQNLFMSCSGQRQEWALIHRSVNA